MGTPPDPVGMRSDRLVSLFTLYLRWYAGRGFHALRIARDGMPPVPPGPVLICTNHPSWWDPVVFFLLMRAVFPGRRGYGPMDEAALGRYGVFRRLGVFGIDPASRAGAAAFLRVGRAVLAGSPDRARHVLWVTAQGDFVDVRARPVRLRPGIAHLARLAEGATILPMALEYPFWNERFPEALVRFGAPVAAGGGRSVAEWTDTLEAGLEDAMDQLRDDAAARDPARFHTVLRGRAGIGGLYDLYRRARTGRGFRAGHEPDREPGHEPGNEPDSGA